VSETKFKIPDDVRSILARSAITGSTLVLPEQLDRETYSRVAKVLAMARGKWDRKAKGHVFPFDPRELMDDAIGTGGIVNQKKTLQFFETPRDLAARMAHVAKLTKGDKVLEPSAGLGRIVRALITYETIVDAVEIDETNCCALRDIPGIRVINGDFQVFHDAGLSLFNAVVMNPPFTNNQDITHIRWAWDMLLSGGRLVAICSEGPFFRSDAVAARFRGWLDEISAVTEKLPVNSFRESGTDVATRLIVASKP
jgi:phospholipid N-methyltransferase